MITEDAKSRRGEPVIVTYEDGQTFTGTIEFGDDTTSCISVYLERDGKSGGRSIVFKSEKTKITSDPGSPRPVWDSLAR